MMNCSDIITFTGLKLVFEVYSNEVKFCNTYAWFFGALFILSLCVVTDGPRDQRAASVSPAVTTGYGTLAPVAPGVIHTP